MRKIVHSIVVGVLAISSVAKAQKTGEESIGKGVQEVTVTGARTRNSSFGGSFGPSAPLANIPKQLANDTDGGSSAEVVVVASRQRCVMDKSAKTGSIDASTEVIVFGENHVGLNADVEIAAIDGLAELKKPGTCVAVESSNSALQSYLDSPASAQAVGHGYTGAVGGLAVAARQAGVRVEGIDNYAHNDDYYNVSPLVRGVISEKLGSSFSTESYIAVMDQLPFGVLRGWISARDAVMNAAIDKMLASGCQRVIALVGQAHMTNSPLTSSGRPIASFRTDNLTALLGKNHKVATVDLLSSERACAGDSK